MSISATPSTDRRRLLYQGLAAACGLLLPTRLAAAQNAARSLKFYNIHTGESLRATYWESGHYLQDSLRQIDFVLRDFRTGEIHPIDPELLDVVHRISLTMDYQAPINVISGYRCPATNAMLAARSTGVAKDSFHIRGMAIDIRLPGQRLEAVRDTAIVIGRGGVGYYPGLDNFVHVDTGPVRRWQRRVTRAPRRLLAAIAPGASSHGRSSIQYTRADYQSRSRSDPLGAPPPGAHPPARPRRDAAPTAA